MIFVVIRLSKLPITYRGKWGRVNQKILSVSQGVYITNMVFFLCIKLILGFNTIKKVHIHFMFK